MSSPTTTTNGAVTKLPRRILVPLRPAPVAAPRPLPPRRAPEEHRVRDWLRRLGPRT